MTHEGRVAMQTQMKKCGVAELLLDPAARHARQHHAERHEAGADRVVRRLVPPVRRTMIM